MNDSRDNYGGFSIGNVEGCTAHDMISGFNIPTLQTNYPVVVTNRKINNGDAWRKVGGVLSCGMHR